MANPKTKPELLEAMANGYAKLNEQISKMSQEKVEQSFGFTCDPKNLNFRLFCSDNAGRKANYL
ncbi:hypothetical protein PRBRB14_12980 [Hallella multisaccharivorax DSM 17128]|uniref:Uncharacterized protein n=1 Tax=Hallella multisaccharivorax DSM 17128 TaxID=688246 RepID=F8NBB8_9BACT|nr:ClbS/DfsB family four-helix bundle protein [Hallella multisaccharivorax]EGN56875.1 hypothetical protein Premu_1458 [Hallella multisaccharivorax DSM 17128]GJG30419.1 hypothetical protein PRBRB14_12980 [Hallella multisaccharivorax DSM 17128]